MTVQTRPLGAQISHMLKVRGVDTIFGIPGVHNQEMYRGIEEAGITHVLARHEQGAGFMADGYARATGKPGVAYVITGPGVCNIMTPMGQAYSDSVPMLVISSCLDEVAATRGQLHQMKDQETAAGCVCDWSETATTAQAAYALIDRALMEFKTQRLRPKHIQVPIALLEAEAPPAPAARMDIIADVQTGVPSDVLEQIATTFKAARRPMVVFGGGAVGAGGADGPARAFLSKTGAASFCTYAGAGITDPDDPLAFGTLLARPESEAVLAQADAMLIVGTDLAEVDLWRWQLGHDCPAVVINLDPEVLAATTARDTRICADATQTLTALNAYLTGDVASDWSAQTVTAYRARWTNDVAAERPDILPICKALQDCLPHDTMIYSDMTQFAYVAKEAWNMDRPGHWHHPYGFGTLGYGMPAAIGGAVARTGQPTLAIAGDYGFQYTVQELGAAVELGLPLPIILWDNGKLKEIEDSMTRAQIAPNSVIAHNPDFCKLAQAYGAYAVAPTSLGDLQSQVIKAFAADGPTLIYITPQLSA